MENKIPKFTFAIASKNNFRYVKYAVKYIRENCYRKDHIIHIGIDGDDFELENYYIDDSDIVVTRGVSGIAAIYNDIVKQCNTDFVVIYHADMIAGNNFDINLYKHWREGVIVSGTRIEPPLHPSDPSKIVSDFGLWPEENIADGFKREKFEEFVNTYQKLNINKITNGVFAPWLIHKNDYLSIGGHDESLNSHSEDRDIFNRFLLNGFDFIQSWDSLVYHLTCRGGQFEHAKNTNDLMHRSEKWQLLSHINTYEFIRKWGTTPHHDNYQYPIIIPKYNLTFNVSNLTYDLLKLLEPICRYIIVSDGHMKNRYIVEHQSQTTHSLNDRLLNSALNDNDVLISFNGNYLSNDSINILYNIQKIISDANDIGEFELDIFNVKINRLIDRTPELIKL